MASVLDIDVPPVVEFRLRTVKMAGQGSFGKNKIQLGQKLQVKGNCVGIRNYNYTLICLI